MGLMALFLGGFVRRGEVFLCRVFWKELLGVGCHGFCKAMGFFKVFLKS
jgi:hypothetical protein